MIVPRFWAEARLQDGDRRVTVRRFGWSDVSPEDAQAHADARAAEALARVVAGESLARRERKVPYNGAEGVPIREEIVERHGDAVVTRNSYGALCLNTPDVLFADVDFTGGPGPRLRLALAVVLLAAAIALGSAQRSFRFGLVACGAALVLAQPLAAALHAIGLRLVGGEERRALARVERFVAGHPDWRARLYRTPLGLRVLAMHRTFDPREPAVAECFRALGTDPIYAAMCLRQGCFRARVSPKPWRIGIAAHLPARGSWPVDPARMPERQHWVDAYDRAALGHASCRFLDELGFGMIDPAARSIQALHDRLCRADEPLPIA